MRVTVVPPVSVDRAAVLGIVAQGTVDRDGRSCSTQAPELPGQTDHEQHEQSEVEDLEDPRVRARAEARPNVPVLPATKARTNAASVRTPAMGGGATGRGR